MLKIGKIYMTIETPDQSVIGFRSDPSIFERSVSSLAPLNTLSCKVLPSKTYVLVVDKVKKERNDEEKWWTSLYYKILVGDEYFWFSAHDLVEVNDEGIPIISEEE